jgi:Flp pilus assembly protein TadG
MQFGDHRQPLGRPARGKRRPSKAAGAAARRCRSGVDRERGQGLVEFSLTLVFLSVLLISLMDLGRAYFTYLALKDAAAEGAYYGSAYPQCIQNNGVNNASPACQETTASTIPYRVRHSAPRGGLVDWTDASAQITIDLPCGTANPCVMQGGEVLTVTVAYSYRLLTPFAGMLSPSQSITLTARSAAVIIRVPDCTTATCK